jgi:hypothetical protein
MKLSRASFELWTICFRANSVFSRPAFLKPLMPTARFGSALAALACFGIATLALPASADDLLTVTSRPGVSQSVFIEGALAAPGWVVLLFAGDNGALHLSNGGPGSLTGNFLVRTAGNWSGFGETAVLYDAPTDHADGMDDLFRLGTDQIDDVNAVVQAIRQRYPKARIALIGTSRGTVTVGNVLKRSPALADAYVLTSPVTGASRGQPALSGMSWSDTSKPVLVVSNQGDSCRVSSFDGAKAMATANHFEFMSVSSSEIGHMREVCGGRSPHGFLGIEVQVLTAINSWLVGQK